MNQGQEKFYGFILERVKEDKVDEANELLGSMFMKQTEGSMRKEDVMDFIPRMVSLLKTEYMEEVKAVMDDFARKIDQK